MLFFFPGYTRPIFEAIMYCLMVLNVVRVIVLITDLRVISEALAEPKLLYCLTWNEYH